MSEQVLDVEAVEMPDRSLAVVAPAQSMIVGGAALASMSEADFEANLTGMKRSLARIERIQRELLVEGEDYGKVPGISKPFLQKPGAEKLGKFGGYAVGFKVERLTGDGLGAPPLSFLSHAQVHLADLAGPIVAEGVGEANSWEPRYRYRRAERVCPDCGVSAIIKGKAEYGGGWVCFKKKGGCGAKFHDSDPAITEQATGDVENPDPWELANTLAKMAKKRSFVDGILTATATSGLFTQDDDSPAVAPRTSERTDVDRETGEIRHPVAVAPAEPKVPWSEGVTTLSGSASTTSQLDGELRETPDGWRLGFALTADRKYQVEATGQLAVDIHDAIGNVGRNLEGLAVTVTGELWMVPWDKEGRSMPAMRRLALTRIATDIWTLPVNEAVAPTVDEFPEFK